LLGLFSIPYLSVGLWRRKGACSYSADFFIMGYAAYGCFSVAEVFSDKLLSW
jgi:hypothetical protein